MPFTFRWVTTSAIGAMLELQVRGGLGRGDGLGGDGGLAAWAERPGGQLVDVLARVPTGRLVVLGEPGTGKTVLMVRLVLDLLARRESGRAQRVVH
jgi:hypothetical protein